MRILIWIRDLTTDKDREIVLPFKAMELNPKHEYMIIDSGSLDLEEFENIWDLNRFIQSLDDNKSITETDLFILCSTYLWHEVREAILDETWEILDTNEINSWHISNDEAYGRFMYDMGYNMLPCDVPEELEDYINWEQNWFALETVGWRVAHYNGSTYILHI